LKLRSKLNRMKLGTSSHCPTDVSNDFWTRNINLFLTVLICMNMTTGGTMKWEVVLVPWELIILMHIGLVVSAGRISRVQIFREWLGCVCSFCLMRADQVYQLFVGCRVQGFGKSLDWICDDNGDEPMFSFGETATQSSAFSSSVMILRHRNTTVFAFCTT